MFFMVGTLYTKVLKPKQIGFTLVEVLLSLFIFSLIAASTVYALRLGINAQEQLKRSDGRLQQLQLSRLLIKDDLLQYVKRSTRGANGGLLIPAFSSRSPSAINLRTTLDNGDEEEEFLFHITRNGWANPDYVSPRSTIQSVYYIIRNGELLRRTYPLLDDTQNQPVIERVLMNGLEGASAKFLFNFQNGEPVWVDDWPIVNNGSAVIGLNGEVTEAFFSPPPLAIEITIIDDYFGEISHLFWIGSYEVNGLSGFDDEDIIDNIEPLQNNNGRG